MCTEMEIDVSYMEKRMWFMYIVPMKDPSPLIRVCAYNIIKLTIE